MGPAPRGCCCCSRRTWPDAGPGSAVRPAQRWTFLGGSPRWVPSQSAHLVPGKWAPGARAPGSVGDPERSWGAQRAPHRAGSGAGWGPGEPGASAWPHCQDCQSLGQSWGVGGGTGDQACGGASVSLESFGTQQLRARRASPGGHTRGGRGGGRREAQAILDSAPLPSSPPSHFRSASHPKVQKRGAREKVQEEGGLTAELTAAAERRKEMAL